jgi:hypothetical protein
MFELFRRSPQKRPSTHVHPRTWGGVHSSSGSANTWGLPHDQGTSPKPRWIHLSMGCIERNTMESRIWSLCRFRSCRAAPSRLQHRWMEYPFEQNHTAQLYLDSEMLDCHGLPNDVLGAWSVHRWCTVLGGVTRGCASVCR